MPSPSFSLGFGICAVSNQTSWSIQTPISLEGIKRKYGFVGGGHRFTNGKGGRMGGTDHVEMHVIDLLVRQTPVVLQNVVILGSTGDGYFLRYGL